jgi:hypothetical protein
MIDTSILLNDDNDWQVLLSFLPPGWQSVARSTGALQRARNFTPETLLRTLMIHLADGCSLRETAVRAKQGGIAQCSDVALIKRLNVSGEWFRVMSTELMAQWVAKSPDQLFGSAYRVRLIDGSIVSEPGATGSTWRIHYSIQLSTLQCDEVYVTKPSEGESFKRFNVTPGDLFIGDRGFGTRNNVRSVHDRDGAVIVRLNATNLPLFSEDGSCAFDLLGHLRTLHGTKIGDWNVTVHYPDGHAIKGRLCALKKSKEAAEKAKIKAARESKKKGHAIKPETLEAAGYVFVFTTLHSEYSASSILEAYRGRWQIELAFKRLKSLLGLSHLRKMDMAGAKAWLHGKLFVAFLIEAMIACGDNFSPWGYPTPQAAP